MGIQSKLLAFFTVILMIIVSFYLGGKLFELADLFGDTTYSWIMKIAIFIILIIANMVIPYLVAIDYPINPLNGVLAMIWLGIGGTGVAMIMIPFWTLMEPLVSPLESIYTVSQLILILTVLTFTFFVPILISLQEETVI